MTSADVLEALHRATGLPIVADFYTRLFEPKAVAAPEQPLFDLLNRLADSMRLRWKKDEEWLQFRSASFYNDRLKEVPNRLLSRWSEARRQQGYLSLDDLCEIAQLTDAQLESGEMAEGAQLYWGLEEWRLVQHGFYGRLRFLAGFTPAQRQEAMSPAGLPFTRMPLAQQQKFIEGALEWADEPLESLEELQGALLRVEYSQPGWFQWKRSTELDGSRWIMPLEFGRHGRRAILPPVRERTKEAALREARRIFPPVTEAMLQVVRLNHPEITAEQIPPQESQIVPSELSLYLIYIPGATNARPIRVVGPGTNLATGAG